MPHVAAPTGVKFVSEASSTGYGRAARAYLHALARSGVPLTWTPMVPGTGWQMYLEPVDGTNFDDEFGFLCNRAIDYDTVFVHLLGPYFPHWRAREPGKKLFGITIWESDSFPEDWLRHMRVLDGIFVPSEWNAAALRRGGITCPVYVVPLVSQLPEAPVAPLPLPRIPSDHFVFYSIGDWKDRKGMHLTVEAFARAFTCQDRVTLVVKTGTVNERRRRPSRWWRRDAPLESPQAEIDEILHRFREPPAVVCLTQTLSDDEIWSLHERGDCFVSLTRCEGWGLGAFEAAFAGRPVIITGHGAQLDFLPKHLSHHIDFRLIRAAPIGAIDQGLAGHTWAEPDLGHAARLMRAVFEHRDEEKERAERLRQFVRASFAAERAARSMLDFAAGLA